MSLRRLLPVLLLLSTGAAHAQSRAEVERAKQSFEAGATAYAAGEYLAAIQAFESAYALTPVPAIGFSLAQAERRQYFVARERRHLDRAVTLFRRYVAEVGSGGRRADALEALSQLEPLQAQAGAGAGAEPEAARPTRLLITCDAPGAVVILDGGAEAPSPLIREVTPGEHTLEVRAPGFFPDKRKLQAIEGELLPTAVTLRERPSTLTVNAPKEAELYLDGAFLSRGGSGLTFSVPSGAHQLAVAEKGHKLRSERLELARGAAVKLDLELEPTRQRAAARGLFVGAASALAASLVTGGLALRAQGDAEELLERRQRGNISAAELGDYNRAVRARNAHRIASVASLALAGGLLATGFFLYELDRPSAEELRRPRAVVTPTGVGATF